MSSLHIIPRVVLLAFVASCAAPCSDFGPRAERLRAVALTPERDRALSELDLSADGRLDAADWEPFDRVAAAARAELDRRGVSVAVLDALYHGPDAAAGSVLAKLELGGGTPRVGALSSEELRVLAVEARWLGLQARVAALGPAALEGRVFGGVLSTRLPGYDPESMEPAAVCAAIDGLDLQPLAAAGIDPTAIFDLDSTVWHGNVTDPFLAALVESGKLSEEANPRLRAFLKTLANVDPEQIDRAGVTENARLLLVRATSAAVPAVERVNAKDAFYNIVGLLRGMTIDEAREVARTAFEVGTVHFTAWQDRAFGDRDGCGMRRIIEKLQARGVAVFLLSATPDVLALEAGALLGVPRERVLGGLLELEEGRYTGEVHDSTYYTKGAILRQWLPAPPLLAFGDSPTSDFSMLIQASMAGFMIHARPDFLALDQKEAGSRLVSLRFDGTEAELAAAAP